MASIRLPITANKEYMVKSSGFTATYIHGTLGVADGMLYLLCSKAGTPDQRAVGKIELNASAFQVSTVCLCFGRILYIVCYVVEHGKQFQGGGRR